MATHCSMAAYNTGDRPQFAMHASQYRLQYSCGLTETTSSPHVTLSLSLTEGLLIFNSPLMVGRNRSDSESVCRSPYRGFEPLSLHTAGWPCNNYMSGHMCASRRYGTPCRTLCTHTLGHGCCQVPYHVIMPGNLIVQHVQSFGCFDTPFVYNFVTI